MVVNNKMNNKNTRESKFNFISEEELNKLDKSSEETLEEESVVTIDESSFSQEVALDEMQIVKDAKLEEIKPIDTIKDTLDDDILEFEFVDEKNISADASSQKSENKIKNKNKIYIGFETRIIILILVVLCLFLGACFFILEACNYGKNKKITYSEKSDVSYAVCVENSTYYNNSCLVENLEYLADIINNVNMKLDYHVDFSEKVNYDLAYHVVGVTKIYDRKNKNKIFFENEDLLIERTDISDNSEKIDLSSDVQIDYKKYNDYVKGYKNKYDIDAEATIEVILYLDEPNETRKISSIVIPLGEKTFGISKDILKFENKNVEIDNDVWTNYNGFCAVFASTLIILALLVLFKTTKFVLKSTIPKSAYDVRLSQILKTYDKYIVSVANGYNLTADKQIIKVTSFEELLDARNTLGKPIIYSKINNIKSEFIVEDMDKIYRYVLKDVDYYRS